MRKLYWLVTVTALVGLVASSGLLDNIITPSLDDFYPEDSGTWYYDKLSLAFIPFPFLPNYEIDVEVVQLVNGKQLNWVAHIGDGTLTGTIVDTSEERYSTCEVGDGASGVMEVAIQTAVVAVCSQIRSMRRIDENKVSVVFICASGTESIQFSHNKPTLMDKIMPF